MTELEWEFNTEVTEDAEGTEYGSEKKDLNVVQIVKAAGCGPNLQPRGSESGRYDLRSKMPP